MIWFILMVLSGIVLKVTQDAVWAYVYMAFAGLWVIRVLAWIDSD